jgi:hypothetical protein
MAFGKSAPAVTAIGQALSVRMSSIRHMYIIHAHCTGENPSIV